MSVQSFKQYPLGEALLSIASWPQHSCLLLPMGEGWSAQIPCLVAVYDPKRPSDDYAATAQNRAYHQALMREQVVELIENSTQQLGAPPTNEQAVKAFLAFYDNDKFIDWSKAA